MIYLFCDKNSKAGKKTYLSIQKMPDGGKSTGLQDFKVILFSSKSSD